MRTLGQTVVKTIANTAVAYAAAGKQIGALLAIKVLNEQDTNNSVLLQQINIIDKDKLGKKLKIQIYEAAIADVGNNNTAAPTSAELLTLVDTISIAAADWSDEGNANVAIKKNLALTVATGASRTFYVLVKADEALTMLHADYLSIKLTFYSE